VSFVKSHSLQHETVDWQIDTDPEVHASKNFPFMLQILCNGIHPFFAALMMDKVWRYTYTTAEQFLAIYLGQLKVLA
jgi:heat shock 70kDa protein 4